MHHEQSNQTILLNIYDRLGAIEANQKAQAHHEQMVRDVQAAVELRLRNLEKFEGRVGAYIWLGGSIASGVLFFLWEGLKYLGSNWGQH